MFQLEALPAQLEVATKTLMRGTGETRKQIEFLRKQILMLDNEPEMPVWG